MIVVTQCLLFLLILNKLKNKVSVPIETLQICSSFHHTLILLTVPQFQPCIHNNELCCMIIRAVLDFISVDNFDI